MAALLCPTNPFHAPIMVARPGTEHRQPAGACLDFQRVASEGVLRAAATCRATGGVWRPPPTCALEGSSKGLVGAGVGVLPRNETNAVRGLKREATLATNADASISNLAVVLGLLYTHGGGADAALSM
jgi:hypothetical protein